MDGRDWEATLLIPRYTKIETRENMKSFVSNIVPSGSKTQTIEKGIKNRLSL